MNRRLLARPIDQRLQVLLAQSPWSGIYLGDRIRSGHVLVTSSRGALLGCAVVIEPVTHGASTSLVFMTNPTVRHPQEVAGELAALLGTHLADGGALEQRNWVTADSPERHELSALGFHIRETSYAYQIFISDVSRRLEKVSRILDRRRPLKPNQRVSGWLPERCAEMRRIILDECLSDIPSADALLTPGSVHSLQPDTTMLAFEGDMMIGFVITRINNNVIEVPVRWVAPGYRNSWVNARLMAYSLRITLQRPEVELVHFRGVEEDHAETHLMCERFGGEQTASSVRLSYG